MSNVYREIAGAGARLHERTAAMGWRLGKSFRVGKFGRVNVSRRGLGASVGIPGLRYVVSPGRGRSRRKEGPVVRLLSALMTGFLLLTLGVLGLVLLASLARGQAPSAPPGRVPSPDSCYRAGPGSEVGPFLAGTAGCRSRASVERHARLSKAGDGIGIGRMVGSGEVLPLDAGTPLLVIATHFTPAHVEVLTPEQFDRQLRSGTASLRPAAPADCLEVRVVEGPHAGRVVFVEAREVGLLTPDLVGRRVVLARPGGAGNFPLLSDVPNFHRLKRAMAAGNLPVAVEMRGQGHLAWVANDVPATVEAIEGGAYRVRLLAGPQRGRQGWVDPAHARPDSSAEASSGPATGGVPSPDDRAGRAATLLRAAKNLEKAGKAKPALETYRRVVAEFGDMPAAGDAAARVKALGP
jgi:hypothetical protein